jgi:hypothetical protein
MATEKLTDREHWAMLKVSAAEKLRGEIQAPITKEESRASVTPVPIGVFRDLADRGLIVWANGYHTTHVGRVALELSKAK